MVNAIDQWYRWSLRGIEKGRTSCPVNLCLAARIVVPCTQKIRLFGRFLQTPEAIDKAVDKYLWQFFPYADEKTSLSSIYLRSRLATDVVQLAFNDQISLQMQRWVFDHHPNPELLYDPTHTPGMLGIMWLMRVRQVPFVPTNAINLQIMCELAGETQNEQIVTVLEDYAHWLVGISVFTPDAMHELQEIFQHLMMSPCTRKDVLDLMVWLAHVPGLFSVAEKYDHIRKIMSLNI